jgi:hypothetical protein
MKQRYRNSKIGKIIALQEPMLLAKRSNCIFISINALFNTTSRILLINSQPSFPVILCNHGFLRTLLAKHRFAASTTSSMRMRFLAPEIRTHFPQKETELAWCLLTVTAKDGCAVQFWMLQFCDSLFHWLLIYLLTFRHSHPLRPIELVPTRLNKAKQLVPILMSKGGVTA